MKELEWNKKSHETVKNFPYEVKSDLGYLIYRIQTNQIVIMPHSRSMPVLGSGCFEFRLKSAVGIFRVFYCLKIENKILIFHAFQKKSERTSVKEIKLGKLNLKDML